MLNVKLTLWVSKMDVRTFGLSILVIVAISVSAAGLVYYITTAREEPATTSEELSSSKKFYIVPTSWTFAIYDENFNRVDRIEVSKGDIVVLVMLPEPFVPKELHEEIEHEYIEKATSTGAMTKEKYEELHEKAEETLGRELYGIEYLPHGVAIKGYEEIVNVDLSSGYPAVVVFKADKVGAFDIYCSVFCGFGHSQMVLDSAFIVKG